MRKLPAMAALLLAIPATARWMSFRHGHSLTDDAGYRKPEDVRRASREVTAAYIAAGVDPKHTPIFAQSMVAEHSELATADDPGRAVLREEYERVVLAEMHAAGAVSLQNLVMRVDSAPQTLQTTAHRVAQVAPAAAGVKTTLMVQVAPAATLPPQLLAGAVVTANSAELVPVTVIEMPVREAVPLFWVLLFEVALSVHHVVVTQHAGWSITKANVQAQVVADETANSRCKLASRICSIVTVSMAGMRHTYGLIPGGGNLFCCGLSATRAAPTNWDRLKGNLAPSRQLEFDQFRRLTPGPHVARSATGDRFGIGCCLP